MLVLVPADPYAEIQTALAEGLLTREEAEAVQAEAARRGQSPLQLLKERGRLSEETLCSLIGRARDHDPERRALDDTAQPEPLRSSSRELPDSPAFPIQAWERYEPVRFLGRGGMGIVFLARDRRLGRDVAIKFVRSDDSELARRFLSEARTQARVHHERVCKVYEVGEVEGRIYIAMQYIDGLPLGVLSPSLTIEQRALIVREAALGLHAAHRAGIIHRDIKPANIMVERTEDGGFRPYVMDFGLARGWDEGATETGTVLGTPYYMSPEQSRGEVGRLDRRADVYSLGATLYHLLSGQPPIPGNNPLEVLSQIATTEPCPLRTLDPDIPADLEAITLQCLEKDRSARYESARALAVDLDRFLAGEPVAAQRVASPLYRARKRLRKHWRLTAASGVALLLLLLAVGWGAKGRREAAVREQLARRFTESVKDVEAMARYSALAPLHDTRPDRAAIKLKMQELASSIIEAGAMAAGPGRYALGRGFLALDEEQEARGHLEGAWQQGFREPRVAYALALAMGRLYSKQLREVERIQTPELREERRREVVRRYREPALAYLKQSAGAEMPSTEYVSALVAYYEERFEDALRHLDAVGRELPWFYEVPALRGDVFFARSQWHGQQGDSARALLDLEAGRKAYAVAASIGESAPSLYEALAELEYAAMLMELYGQGEVAPSFKRGTAAVARALTALPERYTFRLLDARFRRSLAEHQSNQGAAVDELLTQAAAEIQKGIDVAPAWSDGLQELARIYRQWGESRLARGQDPRALLTKAEQISQRIPVTERTYDYYVNLGLVAELWGDYEEQSGDDSQDRRSAAIDAYLKALQNSPRMADGLMNLGISYYRRALLPRSHDSAGDLQQAMTAFEKARSIAPKHTVLYFYEGKIHALLAQRKREQGLDARPELEQALKAYKSGLAINPKHAHLLNSIGTLLLDQAKGAEALGEDPLPLLDQARASYAQAVAAAPEQPNGYSNLGYALLSKARCELARGADPSLSLNSAVAVLSKAIERAPDFTDARVNLGGAHALAAEYAFIKGRDPGPYLAMSTSEIDRVLSHNPKNGEARFYRAGALATQAQLRARKGQAREEDFAAAAAAYEEAIVLSAEEREYRLAFSRFCHAWATFRKSASLDPEPALRRGAELVGEPKPRSPAPR